MTSELVVVKLAKKKSICPDDGLGKMKHVKQLHSPGTKGLSQDMPDPKICLYMRYLLVKKYKILDKNFLTEIETYLSIVLHCHRDEHHVRVRWLHEVMYFICHLCVRM